MYYIINVHQNIEKNTKINMQILPFEMFYEIISFIEPNKYLRFSLASKKYKEWIKKIAKIRNDISIKIDGKLSDMPYYVEGVSNVNINNSNVDDLYLLNFKKTIILKINNCPNITGEWFHKLKHLYHLIIKPKNAKINLEYIHKNECLAIFEYPSIWKKSGIMTCNTDHLLLFGKVILISKLGIIVRLINYITVIDDNGTLICPTTYITNKCENCTNSNVCEFHKFGKTTIINGKIIC